MYLDLETVRPKALWESAVRKWICSEKGLDCQPEISKAAKVVRPNFLFLLRQEKSFASLFLWQERPGDRIITFVTTRAARGRDPSQVNCGTIDLHRACISTASFPHYFFAAWSS